MNTDLYKTIAHSSEGIFKDRGSKFIALAFPVVNENDITFCLEKVKKQYFDARHHCYAWRLGILPQQHYRANDDGEPSNSAGQPIYGQIRSKDLTNILIVVVRYFGGTLLGVGGLINAYRTAASEALNNTQIVEKRVNNHITISYPYPVMNEVMKIIKDEKLEQINQKFEMNCELTLIVGMMDSEKICQKLNKVESLIISDIQKCIF